MGYWSSLFFGGGDSRKYGTQRRGPTGGTSAPVTFDSAMSVSAFWASVRLLTEAVAAMPLRCFKVDEGESIKTPNPGYDLFRLLNYRPNGWQTRTEFIESLMLNLTTRGNFYGAVERLPSGRIVGIIPLQSVQMEVLLEPSGIIYKYTEPDGSLKFYAPESIWHLRLFGDGVTGLSPLQYARISLGVAISSDQRVSTLAATGGKATGILTVDKALKKEQREAIKRSFSELEEGTQQGLFVLEAGMDYQQTSMSPADMQLIENRRFQIEDIARFMGVPSVLINDTSATTTWGSGIAQITEGFYKLNLRPYLERIESSIKRNLMPESDWTDVTLEFDFDALLRADKTTRLTAQAAGVNAGLLTPNEGRAEEGRKAKQGGDSIYLNGTLVPAGQRPLGGPANAAQTP